MRARISTIVALALLGVLAVAGPVAASPGEERAMVDAINDARTANGLRTLAVFWDLQDDARSHTQTMIDKGYVHHSSNLGEVTSGWHILGENVGIGSDPARLHAAFMRSSGHRANILGDYNFVGVGAERAPEGYLYATVIFMKAPADEMSRLVPPAEPVVAPRHFDRPVAPAPSAPARLTARAQVLTATAEAPTEQASEQPPEQPTEPSATEPAQPAPQPEAVADVAGALPTAGTPEAPVRSVPVAGDAGADEQSATKAAPLSAPSRGPATEMREMDGVRWVQAALTAIEHLRPATNVIEALAGL